MVREVPPYPHIFSFSFSAEIACMDQYGVSPFPDKDCSACSVQILRQASDSKV
jgi:hypothetical protein